MESEVRADLREFIASAFLFGDSSRMPAESQSLLEAGVLDSTGVLELIEFLEEKYSIIVKDTETVPANLGSIDGLTAYVVAKIGATEAVG